MISAVLKMMQCLTLMPVMDETFEDQAAYAWARVQESVPRLTLAMDHSGVGLCMYSGPHTTL